MRKKLIGLIVLVAVLLGAYYSYPSFLEGAARFLIVRDRLEPADVIVVLAGDDNGERVEEAVKVYRKGYSQKLLLSGGPLAWNLTAAQWMRKHARTLGIPSTAILTQDRSRSTLEDVILCLPILKKYGFRSLILVTSPTHSRRAKRVFEKVCAGEGIKIISWPAQKSKFKLSRWWTRHEDTQLVIWEYVSLVFYWFKGF